MYRSPSRVILLGHGADELMGGYGALFLNLFAFKSGRHKTAYQKGGWDAVKGELDLDMSRLWERNLGRHVFVDCEFTHPKR